MYLLLHLSIVAAVFTFSWAGLAAFLFMYFMTICLGISTCYHRLLAHNSFKTPKAVRYFLTFWACLAFQRGPIWWVAAHRLHHRGTDQPIDPHTPTVSFLWAHMIWPFFRHPQLDESPDKSMPIVRELSKDLCKDPGMCFLEKHYTLLNILSLAALFGVGYLLGGVKTGVSVLVWGGFFRLLFTLHATWLVNSAAHVWGYRTFKTPDQSRNNWWVALLTFGEGWHNNHHAAQKSPKMGYHWFELDISYACIALMSRFGLAKAHIPHRGHMLTQLKSLTKRPQKKQPQAV